MDWWLLCVYRGVYTFCVDVCTMTYECISMCVHMCFERSVLNIFLNYTSLCFLKQSISLNLELIDSTRLVGPLSPRDILVSISSVLKLHMHTLLPAFMWVLGISAQMFILATCRASILPTKLFPCLLHGIFLFSIE